MAAGAPGAGPTPIWRAGNQVNGGKGYHVLENNGTAAHQAVPHVHFHIIPKPSHDEGLGIGWPAQALPAEAGAQLAAKLREKLR